MYLLKELFALDTYIDERCFHLSDGGRVCRYVPDEYALYLKDLLPDHFCRIDDLCLEVEQLELRIKPCDRSDEVSVCCGTVIFRLFAEDLSLSFAVSDCTKSFPPQLSASGT